MEEKKLNCYRIFFSCGERLRRLKQLLNSDFGGKELAVKIRYAQENPETLGPACSE